MSVNNVRDNSANSDQNRKTTFPIEHTRNVVEGFTVVP